jgi:hypothetical protein
MRRLVTIDLSNADVSIFEAYEATVLSLLGKHGGRLEMRVRSLDGCSETHLLFFPSAQAFDSYRADPIRVAAQDVWQRCGARSVVVEVETLTS